jgi:hypothetical protein
MVLLLLTTPWSFRAELLLKMSPMSACFERYAGLTNFKGRVAPLEPEPFAESGVGNQLRVEMA